MLKTCRELGVAVVAYSPLGRGFLSGAIKKPEDIPEADFRRTIPRFQGIVPVISSCIWCVAKVNYLPHCRCSVLQKSGIG